MIKSKYFTQNNMSNNSIAIHIIQYLIMRFTVYAKTKKVAFGRALILAALIIIRGNIIHSKNIFLITVKMPSAVML